MRRDSLFGFIIILLIVIAGALLIGGFDARRTLGNAGDTASNATNENTFATLRSPINVSYLAYPFPYEIRQAPMSVDEAGNCVRAFIKSPAAEVKFLENMTTFYGMVYDMKSGDTFFSVNPMTGQVTSMSVNGLPGKNVSIGKDVAESIALKHAREYFRGFDSMKGMVLTDSELEDHGSGGKDYTFYWQEFINDVQTLNYVYVVVDADNGTFLGYYSLDLPVPAIRKPTIDEEQAIMKALSLLGDFSPDDVKAYLTQNRAFNMTFLKEPSPTGDLNATITNITDITASQRFVLDSNHTQRQVWYVIIDELRAITIHDANGDHPDYSAEDGHRWWISVDAGTGEVVDIERCL